MTCSPQIMSLLNRIKLYEKHCLGKFKHNGETRWLKVSSLSRPPVAAEPRWEVKMGTNRFDLQSVPVTKDSFRHYQTKCWPPTYFAEGLFLRQRALLD